MTPSRSAIGDRQPPVPARNDRSSTAASAAVAMAVALLGAAASGAQPVPPPPWTIHVVNDTCPDYTWGFDEKTTRRNMAELVRAHLDAMARTDGEPEWNRDRYTMAVTNEALAFLEHYPERKDELVRRLREGRITLSPFLNNTLWGWQSEEAFLRSLYPARRLERAWGVPIDVAHHTELPSLPWGAATLLAGAGVRWLAVPFLDYDTEWGGLDVPPLFVLEGPDGGPRAGRPRRLGEPPPQLHPGARAPRGPEAHRRGVAPPLRGARRRLPVPGRSRPRHPRGPRPAERGRGRAVHGGDPRLERPAGARRAPRQRDARRLLPLDRRGGGEPRAARAARRPRPLLGSLAGHARRARDRRAPGGARDALGRGPRRARRRRRARRGHARAEGAGRVELGDARRPRVERDGRREPEGERLAPPALGRRARRRRPRPGRAGLGGGRPRRPDATP